MITYTSKYPKTMSLVPPKIIGIGDGDGFLFANYEIK